MGRYLPLVLALIMIPTGFRPSRADEARDEFKPTAEEQKILELTNKAREKEGLTPLKLGPTLSRIARAHSANMARQEKMDHVLDEKTPANRAEAGGYRFRALGENVAYSSKLLVDTIFDGWMKSEHHRENILNPKFTEIGIGLASNAKGEVYYTQVFGTPLKP